MFLQAYVWSSLASCGTLGGDRGHRAGLWKPLCDPEACCLFFSVLSSDSALPRVSSWKKRWQMNQPRLQGIKGVLFNPSTRQVEETVSTCQPTGEGVLTTDLECFSFPLQASLATTAPVYQQGWWSKKQPTKRLKRVSTCS